MDGSGHYGTNCPERGYGEKKKLEKNSIWETEGLINVASVSTVFSAPALHSHQHKPSADPLYLLPGCSNSLLISLHSLPFQSIS